MDLTRPLLHRPNLRSMSLLQRVDQLTTQLSERDGEVSALRRQLEEKDVAVKARDTQVRSSR